MMTESLDRQLEPVEVCRVSGINHELKANQWQREPKQQDVASETRCR